MSTTFTARQMAASRKLDHEQAPLLLIVIPAVASLLLGYRVSMRVASEALNAETGLLLLAAVSAAAVSLVELALAKAPAAKRAGVRVLVVTSIALLFSLELALRYGLKRHITFLEKNGEYGLYKPIYSGTEPTWFRVYSPHIEYAHYRPEFRFPRHTNALGLAEREIPMEKPANEYRMFAIGDSFTEGVGTTYDGTWIKEVERRLAGKTGGRALTAFNAGIGGSDPWYEFMLLKEKLLPYRPDMVIVAINFTDIDDVVIRGGRERFLADGTVRSRRQPPSWEWLYGLSFIVRSVVHDVLQYDDFFIKQGDREAEADKAISSIDEAVTAFVQLGRERGFHTIVALHPDTWEATHQQWGREFAKLVRVLKKRSDVDIVDVLEGWTSRGLLSHDAEAMFWPIDGHNNSKGYAAFGDIVAAGILESHVLDGEVMHRFVSVCVSAPVANLIAM